MKNIKKLFFVFILAALFLSPASGYAEDAYAPVYAKPLKAKSLKDPISTLIALPFELIRWPMSQSLLLTEQAALHKKTQWAYTWLKNHGIHPALGFSGGEGFQTGLKLDLPRLTGLQERYPDFIFDTWVDYGNGVHFQTGTEIGVERIAGTGFFATAVADYDRRFEEDFYGIGPDTSRGDGTSFKSETTTVEGNAGYEFSPSLKAASHIMYRNVNISEGEDEQKGSIERFGVSNIPGIRGDKLLSLFADLTHDTRDFVDAPTKGGYQKVEFGYTEGLGDSGARYLTYRGDAAHYFKVGSPRRIFAIHGRVEHHDEVNNGYVPFYDMSRLGGYGSMSDASRTLRSYTQNRFYGESLMLLNLEYRYAIWEYREFQVDAVPFFDFGQTFNEWNKIQWRDFKESYGLEFRVYIARNNLLNLSMAHGDEGTNFFIRSKKAF